MLVAVNASDSTNPLTHASLTDVYMKQLLLMHSENTSITYIPLIPPSLSYIS